MIITVSTSAELAEALSSAADGSVIALDPGTYDGLRIEDLSFSTGVTITSADPGERAVFSDAVAISSVTGLTLEGVDFAGSQVPESFQDAMLSIGGSQNITIRDVALAGRIPGPGEGAPITEVGKTVSLRDTIEGVPSGTGIVVRNSGDIALEALDISDFRTGMTFLETENLSLSDSHIHHIRADGINLSDARNTVIENNLFDSFTPVVVPDVSGYHDHGDFIQFWATYSSYGVEDLVIRGNAMLQGTGGTMQGIWGRFGLRGSEPEEVAFTGIEIYDNLINTSHLHGISVNDATDLSIHHNTLIPAPTGTLLPVTAGATPIIHFGTDAKPDATGAFDLSRGDLPENAAITGNLVVGRNGEGVSSRRIGEDLYDSLGIEVGDNTVLTDVAGREGYYGDIWPELLDSGIRDVTPYIGLPEGGVRELADWVIEAAAAIPLYEPGTVTGTGDDDVLTATESDAVLYGFEGNDILTGIDGSQSLQGGAGDDRLTGGEGADLFAFAFDPERSPEIDVITDLDFAEGDWIALNGGFGYRFFDDNTDPDNELALYNGNRYAVLTSLGDLREVAQHDRVTALEIDGNTTELRFDTDGQGTANWTLRLEGVTGIVEDRTDAGDAVVTLTGTTGDDILTGTTGDDILLGAEGADILYATGGLDALAGGPDADLFVLWDETMGSETAVVEDFSPEEGDRLVLGGLTLTGTDAIADAVASGLLTATASGPYDTLLAGDPDGDGVFTHTALLKEVTGIGEDRSGGIAGVTLTGDDGFDILSGGEGDDLLSGRDGDDFLIGDAGDDRIEGGAGADALYDGAGSDILTGGLGADRFVLWTDTARAGDLDRITDLDFAAGDVLVLENAQDSSATVEIASPEALVQLAAAQGFGLGGTASEIVIQADLDGDDTPDWQIVLEGHDATDLPEIPDTPAPAHFADIAGKLYLPVGDLPGGAVISGFSFADGDEIVFQNVPAQIFGRLYGAGTYVTRDGLTAKVSTEAAFQTLLDLGAVTHGILGGDSLALEFDWNTDGLADWQAVFTDGMGGIVAAAIAADSPAVTGTGTAGDDWLEGGAEADVFEGLDGADRFYTRGGDDWIFGGGGNDTIQSGAGSDVLSGGAGADRFVFTVSELADGSIDRITDLNFGEGDSIALRGFSELFEGLGTEALAISSSMLRIDSVAGLTELALLDTVSLEFIEDKTAVLGFTGTDGQTSAEIHLLLAGTVEIPPGDAVFG